MAATRRMKGPARRWHSLCLLVKAETEAPMQDRINTGVPEELMQRWGRCPETGEAGRTQDIKFQFLRNWGGFSWSDKDEKERCSKQPG